MAWIEMISPAEATGELGEQFAHIGRMSGRVANILAVQSLNPRTLGAHYDLYRTVMFGPSELSRAQREMIAVVVSVTNGCRY